MKKQDEDGKQVIAGRLGNSNKLSEIRKVIYGNGQTMDEKIKARKKDKAKRLDEGH